MCNQDFHRIGEYVGEFMNLGELRGQTWLEMLAMGKKLNGCGIWFGGGGEGSKRRSRVRRHFGDKREI